MMLLNMMSLSMKLPMKLQRKSPSTKHQRSISQHSTCQMVTMRSTPPRSITTPPPAHPGTIQTDMRSRRRMSKLSPPRCLLVFSHTTRRCTTAPRPRHHPCQQSHINHHSLKKFQMLLNCPNITQNIRNPTTTLQFHTEMSTHHQNQWCHTSTTSQHTQPPPLQQPQPPHITQLPRQQLPPPHTQPPQLLPQQLQLPQ